MPLPGMVGDIQMFLLGDVFLRNYYSVYDFMRQSVRLAANIHSAQYVSIGKPHKYAAIFFGYSAVLFLICIASIGCLVKYNKK